MLPVAGCVAPPGIVGDDAERLGARLNVVSAIFPIDRLVADDAAQGDIFPFGTEMQGRNLFLSHAATHYSSQPVVYDTEEGRVGHHLHADHQLGLLKGLATAGAIGDESGIVGFVPVAVPQLSGSVGAPLIHADQLDGRSPEEKVGGRFRLQEGLETLPGRTLVLASQDNIGSEGFRRQQQHGSRAVRAGLKSLPQQVQQDDGLLCLGHGDKFLVRIEVGLGDHYIQRPFGDFLILAPDLG